LPTFRPKTVDRARDASRQDTARDARRRNGGAARSAVRAVLRQRRFDALFVLLAGLYVERTGDEETLAELWPAIEAALQWIDGQAIPTRTGSSNIGAPPSRGLPTRAGRISFDAIFHADGQLAEGYIALAEVQGYVFAGKRLAARWARRLGMAIGRHILKQPRCFSPSASKKRSGAKELAPMRWRSTAPSSRAGCELPTRVNSCSPALSEPIVPGGSRPI